MTDVSLWLPLGTAAIGAGAAIAGNALGPTLGARREHQQWLRGKRAELLEAFYSALNEADEAGAASMDLFERLSDTSSRAAMYSSRSMANKMRDVRSAYVAVLTRWNDPSEEKRESAYVEWRVAVRECREAIRSELAVD